MYIFLKNFTWKCTNKLSMWDLHLFDILVCTVMSVSKGYYSPKGDIWFNLKFFLTYHHVWCPSLHKKCNVKTVSKHTIGNTHYLCYDHPLSLNTLDKLLWVNSYHFDWDWQIPYYLWHRVTLVVAFGSLS